MTKAQNQLIESPPANDRAMLLGICEEVPLLLECRGLEAAACACCAAETRTYVDGFGAAAATAPPPARGRRKGACCR
jgi:hypothetical protein